jgi:hypothetical protein
MKFTQANDTKITFIDAVTEEVPQENIVILKILALGNKECEAGKLKPIEEVVARIKSQSRKSVMGVFQPDPT